MHFYDQGWRLIGTKKDLSKSLERITGIGEAVLFGGRLALQFVCVARKMSWAACRKCTRKEDQAYYLLGLFDLNMPLLYDEGGRAFRRFQQQICAVPIDQSIFTFSLESERRDIFAPKPRFLALGRRVACVTVADDITLEPPSMSNVGLQTRAKVLVQEYKSRLLILNR